MGKLNHMDRAEFYRMTDYCEAIKGYFEQYDQNPLDVEHYGSAIEELKQLIDQNGLADDEFAVRLMDLVGGKTRVLRGVIPNLPFLDWIGGRGETMTREYFVNTMKSIWQNL